MAEKNKITIILTSYNHAKYLREAIDSVLNQTYSNFELILWDDASTDESWEIINSYTDPRMRAFRNNNNQGGGNIRRAISKAGHNEYIAIQHSDDVWESQKLEKQVAFLEENPQIGAVFSHALIITEDGAPFRDKNHFYYNVFDQPNRNRQEWLNYFFYNYNALCHPSLLIRRQSYEDCGWYKYGLVVVPDYDMWVRLCMKHEIHILPEKLVRFRVRENELNTSGDRPETRIRWPFEFLQVLNNYRGVRSSAELIKIFPNAQPFIKPEGFDVDFALAMVALGSKLNRTTELFGLSILFEILNDPDRSKRVNELYGFSHRDFIALTARHDVFSTQMIAGLNTQLAGLKNKLAEMEAQVAYQNQAIQSLTTQLQEIKRGVTWEIYLLIVRLRLALLPPGSRRERYVHQLMRMGQVLRLEGVRSFLDKIINKFQLSIRRSRIVPLVPSPDLIGQTAEDGAKDSTDVYVPLNPDDITLDNSLAKVIAFYLPQFHPIPENDAWWGRGFTEWTNVSKAAPNFEGHYQPHLPGELGFYDLRIPDVQKRQVELAKKYGIYGFCFYYYWFAGKRLLERPLDDYMANTDLDLPFCLCWANENWTRRWDGAEHEMLIAQVHTEDEYLHFIRDISPTFRDARYIQVEGKPLLMVYRVNLLPNPQKAAEIWRSECRRMGVGEIYLVAVQSFDITDPRPYGFDAAVEFPPHGTGNSIINQASVKIINPEFRGYIYDYCLAARTMLEKPSIDYTLFKTVMVSWDNTARKQNDPNVFINSSPSIYQEWLEAAMEHSQKYLPEDKRFVFINAWNEWAEGTHLEPDRKYGYAYLQATAQALDSAKKVIRDTP